MFNVVLLDLDNTLIHNPDYQFAIAFMQCIDEHFQKSLQVEHISSAFRKGIQKLGSQVNQKTNTNVMIDTLMHESKQTQDSIRASYETFYEKSYPSLQQYISPVEIASRLIEYLLNTDIKLIIATNPIYPTTAIHQRLKWANLDRYIDEFTLITSSDNMHVAKPNPAYYSEILNKIDVPASECMMVGDSLKNDINPAHKIGLQTYHILETIHSGNFMNMFNYC